MFGKVSMNSSKKERTCPIIFAHCRLWANFGNPWEVRRVYMPNLLLPNYLLFDYLRIAISRGEEVLKSVKWFHLSVFMAIFVGE